MKNLIKSINEANKNYVFSPVATYYALLLLAQITSGDTKKEILKAIGLNKDELLEKSQEIYSKLNNGLEDNKVMLNSSFWLNKNINVLNDSINQIVENNSSSIKTGEMGTETFDNEIRHWINWNTRKLLKDSVANIHTSPGEILDLFTTIYLKGKWVHVFDAKKTKMADFTTVGGKVEKCNFMKQSLNAEDLYIGKNFTAIQLWINNIGHMTFVLPNEGYEPKDIKDDEDLIECLSGNTKNLRNELYDIDVSIPKFDVKADGDIKKQLKNIGVNSIFDMDKADYSPISNSKEIVLSKVEQASRLKIDEKGVEGASCIMTSMGFGCCIEPLKRIKFILDRPFMFSLVHDNISLFVGTITNPNEE